MITVNKYGNMMNRLVVEIVGLSTDTRPTEFVGSVKLTNGSSLYEMDTKKLYIYDEANKKWWEM